jgi:FKBP-type peptidyl-prolyl cis-trans isomerase
MKLKVLIALLIVFPLSVLSQKTKEKFTTSPDGLKYFISLKVKKGKPVQKGDMVRVLYRSFVNDTVEIAKSDNREAPYEFVAGNGDVLKGLDAAVQLLKVGEKATVIIPSHLAYGNKKFGKVPENATIRMELEVLGTYPAFYAVDYNQLKKTSSGLEYVFVKQNTTSETLKKGNYVAIRYTGYYFTKDGKKKIFDSSMKSGNTSLLQYGVNKFIKGLDEGLSLMKVGDSATFIIPPSLGYGAKDNQLVPGNSTLGFDVYVERQIDPFFDESKITYKQDPSGFSYCFVKDVEGPSAQLNDNVYVNLVGYYLLANGAKYIFESTYEKGEPQHFRLGKGIENPAWMKLLTQSSVGDQVIMAIPPENARMELKKLIPENVTVFFEYTLEAIKEPSFLKGEPVRTVTTESNVEMKFMVEGNGPAVDTNSVVFMHYTGYTIDSLGVKHVFDSSFDTGKPFPAEPGKGKVIKGWEEAMLQMKEGDQVKVTIPSEAGYGSKGVPPLILQDETLYFDLFAVKVLKKETESNQTNIED